MQEWTSDQWSKWQNAVIKEELNELALSKKEVEKPKLILLSNRNLNKRTNLKVMKSNVIT
jgi:hypothetical protein